MKQAKKISLLLMALLTVIGVLFACADKTDAPDGTESGTASGTETPDGDGTIYELASKTTSAKIALRDGQPYIVSLKTESGVEKAGEAIPFNLPSLGKNVLWTHTSTDSYDDGEGGVGYVFRFQNDDKQVTYDLYAVARPEMAGPFEFFGYVTNNGNETFERFAPRSYFTVNVDGESAPTAWTFSKESGVAEGYTLWWTDPEEGRLYEGTGIYHTVLDKKRKAAVRNDTTSPWNGDGQLSMMYIDYGTDGLYFGLEWTNGMLEAEGLGDGTVSLTACLGSGEGSFKSKIAGNGGTFFLPPVYLGVYDGDVDDGSNIFKHWFLRYKAPDNMYENPEEPFIQMDLQATGAMASSLGFEAIKWDIAWWNDTGSWSDLRTLEVRNPAHLYMMEAEGASTLAEYTQSLKNNGVSLTMYVLLRDLATEEPGQPSSIGPEAHPEWFGDCNTHFYGADLGNEECVAFFQNYMTDFFGGNGITTWRSDFQPILSSSYMAYENRHYGYEAKAGDMTYWCTVGFGELVDHLIENVENFRYESCSEGGSMKDLFTATKASVINCDDSGDYMSLHMTFYDASYVFHPAQLQLPTVTGSFVQGNDRSTAYSFDYLYGLRASLVGGVMLNFHGDAAGDYATYWPYYVGDLYPNVMRPLIRNGNLYHILPRPDGVHWDGLQYIDLDSENEVIGMVLLWKPTDTEGPQKTVKLRGLEADASYQLTFEDRTEQNAVYTGAELMENGLTVTIAEATGSEMIWISHANEP